MLDGRDTVLERVGKSVGVGEGVHDTLRLDAVSKKFGSVIAVRNVNLQVPTGSILSLLGPSGCGKTTLLRMVAGLLQPTSGRILIDGEDVTDVPANRRRLGMVFQNYALFPHMTCADNVMFGLRMRKTPREQARKLTAQSLDLVRMGGMGDRFPRELSGGQQQRIALARAIVTEPKLLLLDEPFGALDRLMRESMQIELKELQRTLGITFLFVTHDQEEALTLSDQIAVVRNGAIEQIGAPHQIFEQPSSLFVAEFFGDLNRLPVEVVGKEAADLIVQSNYGRWHIPFVRAVDSQAVMTVRALDVRLSMHPPVSDEWISLPAILEDLIYKGKNVVCRVRLADGRLMLATEDPRQRHLLEIGAATYVAWKRLSCHVFPADLPNDRSKAETLNSVNK
jgi:spermidine/putrescine ABC transporter ATP-binding subunit